MDPSRAGAPYVVAVGPLPPPVHGMAEITRRVLGVLAERGCPAIVADVSPSRLQRGPLYHLRKSTKVARAWLWLLGARLTRRGEGRLYLAVDSRAGLLYTCATAGWARLLGYRAFLHHHSWRYLERRDRRMAWVARAAGPRAVHLVLCDAMEAALRASYPAVRSTLVVSNAGLEAPAGVTRRSSAPRIHDESTPASAGLRVGHLGNLCPEKGLDLVLRLFEALHDARPASRLVLAGPPVDDADRAAVDRVRRAHPGAVDHRGPVDAAGKARFFGDVDVFVLPSRSEAQPLVVLEALRAGVPVLCVARGCIPALLAHGGGTAVPSEDDYVARALERLLEWADDPGRLARAADEALSAHERLAREGRPSVERLVERLCARTEAPR